MQNSLDRIFQGLEETLRTIVAPTITDPYILSQVTSVAEIIGNLSTRVQWRSDQLLEIVLRVRPILELAGRGGRSAAGSVLGAPPPTAGAPPEELLAARDAHLFALREVQRGLEADPDEEIEAAVREFLTWQIAYESTLLRTGMFSAPKNNGGGGAPVKLGMVLPIQSLAVDLAQLWEELREEVAAAEEAGFDAVFLPEFHQAHGGAFVSPLLLGAGLLQGTSRIRFGPAVLATPLHHPVRLAEDAVMLDWITRGRLILGLGIGHQVPDFAAYGVDRSARAQLTEETVAILEKCFAGEPFSYSSEHFQITAHLTPRPYTTPRPPIWMGSHSDAGLDRAGRLADRWMCDPERSVEVVAQLATKYRAAAERAGRPSAVALFREGWVGESQAECERVWAPNALAVHRLYYNVGAYSKKFEPWVDEVRKREDFTRDRLAPGRFVYGSSDEVVDTLREWGEVTGADYVALRMRHPGGPSHAETMEAIRRFGTEVIPKIEGAQR